MFKKCRVWKSNTYDLNNFISKQEFREKVVKLIDNLLLAEDKFHNTHKDGIEKYADVHNIVRFPPSLPIEERIDIKHLLVTSDLLKVKPITYGGHGYSVYITIEREVSSIRRISSSRKIVIGFGCRNNDDGLLYTYSIPYLYENRRALFNTIDSVYSVLVNLYKDYGQSYLSRLL